MSRLPLSLLFALTVLCIFIPSTPAQNAINAPRIVSAIDESARVTLKGGVPGHARPQFDRGRASASAQLTSVRLVLARSAQQDAALRKFMGEQINPSSPNYHKWLTPQQFGKLYGPSDADISTLVTWLQAQGFTVQPVAPGRISIAFSGSVAQLEAAFQTEIHSFDVNGEEFLANVKNPSIPAALAPVITGVAKLDTIQPRPLHVVVGMGQLNAQTKRLAPIEESSQISGARPFLTTCTTDSSGNCEQYGLYLTPADAASIYDSPNSYNEKFTSSGTPQYTGSGVTIGIGGNSPIQASTVVNYRSRFLGDTTAPTITNLVSNPATNPNDTDEAYIDTELAGGMAPKAAIHFYTSANLTDAIEQAATDNTVDIFSLSFGSCEMGMGAASNTYFNNLWQQFAAQGIAVTVSTGDSGSAGCDNDNTEQAAQSGLQVSGFASTPYNIAVGGTDFYALLTDFSTYVDTSSSGNASTYYRTAGGYIPEATWNDSTTANGLLAQNAPNIDSKTGKTNIVGGSGGKSSCITTSSSVVNGVVTTTCASGYTKPSWQQGPGVPSDNVRDLPDISLMAGNGYDNATWLVCTDTTGTSGSTTITANCSDTTVNGQSTFFFVGYGGTSTSAPAFAGILAMVQEMEGSRLGIGAVQTLYQLAASSHAAAVFHDTTQGNISVPCTSGSPNCSKNTAGNYFLTGYDTATGYDLATGLGSVDVAQLINFWQSPSGTQTATVSLGSSIPSTVSVNDSFSVPVTVTGSSGTPTGSVRLVINSFFYGAVYTASKTLENGAATFTVPPYALRQGDNIIYASYGGDTTYASAVSGDPSFTVNPITPTVTVTPSAATIGSSASFTLAVSVSGPSGAPVPTGSVEGWADNKNFLVPQELVNGSYTFTVPANSLTPGSTPIEVDYGSDGIYGNASGTTTVNITAPATFSLSGSTPSFISAGASASSTITVTTSTAYAGSVALTCALTSSPSGAQHLPTCIVTSSPVSLSSSATSATATVNFSTTAASAVPGKLAKSNGLRTGAATLLALLVFLGIPARRRAWRTMLGVLILIGALGAISACGGGGSGGGGGGNSNLGTTAGTYTFTITGTGTPAVTPAPTTTITLTVN